jgi:hypothetical protein
MLAFCPPPASAQEMLGAVLGNYAGVNSTQLNPSALANSKTWLDLELFGIDAFMQNNMLYQSSSDYSFSHFFQSGYHWPTHAEGYGTEVRVFYVHKNTKPKNAYVDVRINGPGAMLVWGKSAFAVTTAFRNVFSAYNVPYDAANFAYLGMNYRPQQNINYQDNKPFSLTQMSWVEIGLTYAYEVYSKGFNKISAGISARRLMGYSGVYANSYNLNYNVIDDSTLQVRNMKAEMGISAPVDYDNNQLWNDKIFKGGGFSFDLGVTYQRLLRPHENQYFTKLCAPRYEDYLYRISFALIDVGAISFNTHSRKYVIDNRASYWDQTTHIKFTGVNQMMDSISYMFYGDRNAAKAGNKFTIWLPSAFSIQFDYHLNTNTYINASLIYPITFSKISLHRPAELSITPRYEKSWFEISVPLSLYDWYLPRIGLALRVYGFTIGTDKLGGYFNISNFTGLDFYFSVKYSLDKGSCHDKNSKRCGNMEFRPD